MTPEPAEHTRFHGYVHALSQVSDADECDLLAVILDDPDRAMADSAVIGHLDHRGAPLGAGETFADWSLQIARVLAVLAEQRRTSRIRNTDCSRICRRPG